MGVALACRAVAANPSASLGEARFGDVISVSGTDLSALTDSRIDEIGLLACDGASCRSIPMQIDERDGAGVWVLDQGPQPNADVPPQLFDDNDVLLFMATDAGEGRAPPKTFPAGARVAEIELRDPLAPERIRRVYAFAPHVQAAPMRRYVAYDWVADRFTGARVRMGYGEGVPTYMSIDASGGPHFNALDRLKVRATASLFWGWLRFSRDESDLSTEVTGWRAGAIRVIRYQSQRVRLGWGIRSPTFRSYTYFYRDYAELPLTLRLRVPPTYFFTDILIEVILDFRDLRGWRLYLDGFPEIEVGRVDAALQRRLNQRDDVSFALLGDDVNLVQTFLVSPSLDTVRKRFIYRETDEPDPPESVIGSLPGVGYALDRWENVGAGEHGLTAVSYAVPPEVDIATFLRSRSVPFETTVRSFPTTAGERRLRPAP